MEEHVTLQMTLTEAMAQRLWTMASRNFYAEQPDRFELLADFDLPLPNDPKFDDGSLFWCDGYAEALMLLAYEQQTNHLATVLWDVAENGDLMGCNVVLSSRPYNAG